MQVNVAMIGGKFKNTRRHLIVGAHSSFQQDTLAESVPIIAYIPLILQ